MPIIAKSLWDVLGKAVNDDAFRQQLLANPTATIKAAGGDIGNASVKLDWVEGTNALNIVATNAGADWNGAVLLTLKK